MLAPRALDRSERYAAIERDEAAAISHRKSEQVNVRQLSIAANAVNVEYRPITKCDGLGPEVMVGRRAEGFQAIREGCGGSRARRVRGIPKDPQDAVFRNGAARPAGGRT